MNSSPPDMMVNLRVTLPCIHSLVFQAQLSLELNYSPPDGSIRETLFGVPPVHTNGYNDSMDGIETKFVQPASKIPRRGSRMSLPGFKHENGTLDGSLLSLPTPNSQKKVKSHR